MRMAPGPRLRAIRPFPPPLTEATETITRPAAAPASTTIPSPRPPLTGPPAETTVAPLPRLSARMPRLSPFTAAAADTIRSDPDGAPWAWIPSCPAPPPTMSPVAATRSGPVPLPMARIP